MKTKIYSLLILCAALFCNSDVKAQAGRYANEIFSQVTIDSVLYSSVYNLKMDIYQPVGDTAAKRPVIVLAHGGSFVSGTRKDDGTIIELCTNFAKRGYVTASIDYRLASISQISDSIAIINEVIQSLSDGKAAVRYFSKDAATTNVYKIDTNLMFVGGNSAGAVMAMHYGYIDSVTEVPAYLQTIINNNGGYEGNSGNAGYKSKINAVIDMAGGLNIPEWVGPCNIPSVNAQGDQDNVVPYYCADAEQGFVPVRLCGLGSIEPLYTEFHTRQRTIIFPGDGHVPWQSDTAKFNRIDTLITGFLVDYIANPVTPCSISTGVNEVAAATEISMFPNPATNLVNVHSSLPVSSINVYDETGRQVSFTGNLNAFTYQINTASYSRGIYFVKFETGNITAPVVKRIVIE